MATVNTNQGAMIALQNLSNTNNQIATTQNRISTGLKVGSAKDNGAIFAIAQNMRADVAAFNAVDSSLSRAGSTSDVAIAAAEGISDLLIEMKEKALAAADSSLDTASRDAMNEDFTALRDQIATMVSNADFNGVNLVDGSTVNIQALADADNSSFITVSAENMSLSGSVVTLASTATISTAASASTAVATITASLENTNKALARLGVGSKKLELHQSFVGKLSDALTVGIGNLVDADLAQESAKLQSLQVKQQLGVQALGIANSAPQLFLGMF